MGLTYRESGVDVEGGNKFVRRIGPLVKKTFSERVITDIGGFGALFSASFPEMKEPVLVSGTDGVGTKLQIARAMKKHDTIGIDAVAMCVNDIITSGARPLFFLDYISCGKLDEDVMVNVVAGIARGCEESACSLVGGETAEHPNIMADDEYDIAGFAVGIVDKAKIINGSRIKPGDKIIGLPSSGIHSNGYSMVRKLFFDIKGHSVHDTIEGLDRPLGEVLLEPTRLYAAGLMAAIDGGADIKGLVHVTGGGFYENVPRILPEGTGAEFLRGSFSIPPVFQVIQRLGEVEEREMFTTFNMGIGMMIFAASEEEEKLHALLRGAGEKPVTIGEVTAAGTERVTFTAG